MVSVQRASTGQLNGATFAMARLEHRYLHSPFSKEFVLGLKSSAVQDAKRCALRMLHLHGLRDDWYDEDSSAPTPLAMTSAVSLFNRISSLMSVASIFPTYEGGVLLEYENDCWDWSVEIFPDGDVEVHGSEIMGGTDCREQCFRTLIDAMETIQQTVG